MDDKHFVNNFVTILAILVGIAFLIGIIAVSLAGKQGHMDLTMIEVLDERTKPIGKVHIGDAPPIEAAPAAAAPAAQAVAMGGEEAYRKVCASCHDSGVLNSPKYGDPATWAGRSGDLEALYASAINGKNQMPAKGGRVDLPDETIKAAVDYLLESVR